MCCLPKRRKLVDFLRSLSCHHRLALAAWGVTSSLQLLPLICFLRKGFGMVYRVRKDIRCTVGYLNIESFDISKYRTFGISNLSIYRNIGSSVRRLVDISKYRNFSVSNFRYIEISDLWYTELSIFRNIGISVYPMIDISKYRIFDISKHRTRFALHPLAPPCFLYRY